MKILDIPQSGKRGPNVSLGGRFGQTSREMVIPTDPRTGAQLRVRRFLSDVASKWRTLTQAQRDAWTTEASQHKSLFSRSGSVSRGFLESYASDGLHFQAAAAAVAGKRNLEGPGRGSACEYRFAVPPRAVRHAVMEGGEDGGLFG